MKKNKSLLSFISLFALAGLFISGDLLGQTVFTYKEVYDITPGTKVKTFYKGYSGYGIHLIIELPDSYDLDSVQSKIQTSNGDSIYVSVRRKQQRFKCNYINLPALFCVSIDSSSTDTNLIFKYPYFNQPIQNPLIGLESLLSLDTIETTVFDDIPAVRFEAIQSDSSSFSRYKEITFVKGVGGPFFHHQGGDGFEGSFDYKYYLMDVSINQQTTVKESFLLKEPFARPNPTKGQLFISEGQKGSNYSILDLMGNVVVSGKMEDATLNLNSLPSGVYMFSLQVQNGEVRRQRIIKI